MIYDEIKNIRNYAEIKDFIADFILGLTSDVSCGKVFLTPDNLTYANIEEYITKLHTSCRLEAHRKYIDIQILLGGVEELDYTLIDGLEHSVDYDENRDIVFFKTPERKLNKVILEKGKFVLLYPHEAHQPQMAYDNLPSKVKKVVVKIPV